jgi:hypothetical protein
VATRGLGGHEGSLSAGTHSEWLSIRWAQILTHALAKVWCALESHSPVSPSVSAAVCAGLRKKAERSMWICCFNVIASIVALMWQPTRTARKAVQDSIKRRGYAALYMFREVNREISPVEQYK